MKKRLIENAKKMDNGICTALLLFILVAGTSCDGGSGGGTPDDDPYAGLRSPARGEILCSGDSCCIYYCASDEEGRECITRDPQLIVSMIEEPPEGCSGLVFPEWFYAHDCFVDHELWNVSWNDWQIWSTTISGDPLLVYFPIECICGRAGTTYSSSAIEFVPFYWAGCDSELVPVNDVYATDLFSCEESCTTCYPRCTNRQCGPDGCGGSCGDCLSSETCSAGGQCVSGSGSSCSDCLATCRGYEGCCTGCGCMCESECGMCW
jgi:hypothetical protein